MSDADRRRQLEKIEKILGADLWSSSIEDEQGFTAPKAIVEAELYQLEQRCAALGRMRSRGSKPTKRAIKQFGAALRKAKLGLPEDFRLSLGIDRMIYHLEFYERITQAPETAGAQREATLSAMMLCETFGIPLTTTRATVGKTGVFCRLAAALSGDDDADMQHYCRELVQARRAASAKPGQI
jgi:hypothetical protein